MTVAVKNDILIDKTVPDINQGRLIKSKTRVKTHGEVFTPSWMVEKMVDLVDEETKDIYKTFLEPAAGNGNFLLEILSRKLNAVVQQYPRKQWLSRSLFALASIYGIEILKDNLYEAREAMMNKFITFHLEMGTQVGYKSDWYKAARYIIHQNIIWGDTLKKQRPDGGEMIFNEWQPVSNSTSKVNRFPFTFSSLFDTDKQDGDFTPPGYTLLTLFDIEDDPMAKQDKILIYKTVDIKCVYKEVKI